MEAINKAIAKRISEISCNEGVLNSIPITPKHLQKVDFMRASGIHLNILTMTHLRKRNVNGWLSGSTSYIVYVLKQT